MKRGGVGFFRRDVRVELWYVEGVRDIWMRGGDWHPEAWVPVEGSPFEVLWCPWVNPGGPVKGLRRPRPRRSVAAIKRDEE